MTPDRICIACGTKLPPRMRQCRECGKWNLHDFKPQSRHAVSLDDVNSGHETIRLKTGPWDYAFGDGIVPDSVTLFAGEPGAGKSTLLLQVANAFAETYSEELSKPLIIATEESEAQIAARAKRLDLEYSKSILVLNGMGGIDLFDILARYKPGLVILDSLPGFTGSGLHKDESLRVISALKLHAQANLCPSIVVDHITKESDYAGFMALQHAVDTLLKLEKLEVSDRRLRGLSDRVLSVKKNRHGPVPREVAFAMTAQGLTHAKEVTRDSDVESHT